MGKFAGKGYLLDALTTIAAFPRGGMVETGSLSGDRDKMVETARQALMDYTRSSTYIVALAKLGRS